MRIVVETVCDGYVCTASKPDPRPQSDTGEMPCSVIFLYHDAFGRVRILKHGDAGRSAQTKIPQHVACGYRRNE